MEFSPSLVQREPAEFGRHPCGVRRKTGNRMVKGMIATVMAMAIAGTLLLPAIGEADTADVLMPQRGGARDGWQAGPCLTAAPSCSPSNPAEYLTTAGVHPPVEFAQFSVGHIGADGLVEPLIEPLEGRMPRTARVDLPPGLWINPNASEKCSLAEFEHTVP